MMYLIHSRDKYHS